jgi:hypothetical protein
MFVRSSTDWPAERTGWPGSKISERLNVDILSVALALVTFALLYVLIFGIDRI